MFQRAQSIFVIFLAIFYRTYCGDSAIKNPNEKRHDGADDYQMCLESFDVHRDKIIKTQDSRDMGAKYLSVMDLDSRIECLKYCCETEQCDVFIFEEKKPGSCYLFQCGPLHDFKCKFTRHTNYTSAVRTNYPTQSKQEEEEIRISQQEHELKSLRKNTEIKSDYGFTETPVKSVVVTQIPKLIPTTPAPMKPACSRNQYECRSSGDCIAIYNVCDGIPQCADGSDEASDLVCPTEKSTISSIPQMPHPSSDILRYQQLANHKSPLNSFYPMAPEINLKNWETQNLPQQMSHQNVLYPGQSVDVPQMHKNYGLPGYQWDYQPMYEQKDLYVPVDTFQKQNVNPYEQQPHIFNHKGLSVIGNNEADRELYTDPKHSYPSHFSLSNKAVWQETPVHLSPSVAPNFQPQQVTNVENVAKSTMTPACDTSGEQKKELKQTSEPVKKEEKTDSKHTNKASKQVTEKSLISANEVAKHNHGKESKDHKSVVVIEEHARTHERVDLVAERLQIFKNDVLRPKGAVVSLSLGLIATAITVALIVCRLRVIKRRGRCGHGPYAHDADYLVNGMYL